MAVGVCHIRKKPMYKDIVRFWQCVFPPRLSDGAVTEIRTILNDSEYKVFQSMYSIDRIHGYEVYMEMLRYASQHDISIKNELKKAILLHDVGKSHLDISVLDRVIVGVLNKLPGGFRSSVLRFPIFAFLASSYNKNAQHPEAGAQILEGSDIDTQIVRLVRYHHDREICHNELGTEGQLIYAIDNYF